MPDIARYDAKILRVRDKDVHADHGLERELRRLGREGWYPSGSVGDVLILSRLVSAGPAVRATVTYSAPKPIPKEGTP
jgi:hypothetical protein